MIGDRLVITDYHRAGSARIMDALSALLQSADTPVAVSICGESGSGKSEMAHCVAESLEAEGQHAVILAQDDYFRLPPKTNYQRRLEDISWVGPGEVRLELLDEHIMVLKGNGREPLAKPLVHFDADRIGSELVRFDALYVVVAEGTYTGMLHNVDLRAFINRDYRQTKKARLARRRDPDIDFLEKVLAIEHEIIRTQKARADVVIGPPEEERGPVEKG